MISSGMDQVKQLKQMVTQTKQSLQDQKRLQYLENLYRDKILQDEIQEEITKEMMDTRNGGHGNGGGNNR